MDTGHVMVLSQPKETAALIVDFASTL
jgi:hypothetical protein